MRLLELFSGTKSIGRAFEAFGWQVTSLDSDPQSQPTICEDVLKWDYKAFQPGHFDLVWASPVCTEFSRAMTRRPRQLEEGDRLVLRTVEIIGYLRPRWWAIENPRSGLLKTRSFMKDLPFDDVTYCQYGYRLSLSESDTHLEQPALAPQSTRALQGSPLRGLQQRSPR